MVLIYVLKLIFNVKGVIQYYCKIKLYFKIFKFNKIKLFFYYYVSYIWNLCIILGAYMVILNGLTKAFSF